MPKGGIVEKLIVERPIVERLFFERLVVIELLKDWLSLMSTLEHEVNKFHVKVEEL
jgi:hypothetical protein